MMVYNITHVFFLLPEWSTEVGPVVVSEFSRLPGPAVSIGSDPLQLFSLFTDNLFSSIVQETNHYASTVLAEQHSPHQ